MTKITWDQGFKRSYKKKVKNIEEALGSKVDIVRLRDKMNKFLRQRIERDTVYV